MHIRKWLICITVIYLLPAYYATLTTLLNGSTMATKLLEWSTLANSFHEPNRMKRILDIGHAMAGLHSAYRRKSTSHSQVMVSVISHGQNNAKYIELLKNWLCNIKQFDLKLMLYVVDQVDSRIEHTIQMFNVTTDNLRIVNYPNELFWQIVSKKSTEMVLDRHRSADYLGVEPSFEHFGSLVMLVPVLELLHLGFDVLFADIDIALFRNPVPFVVKGSADIIFSMEIRNCRFPSFSARRALPGLREWHLDTEPNTGVMFVRSSQQSLAFFTKWLQACVDENIKNDQKALKFRELNVQYSDSCRNPSDSQLIPGPAYNKSSNDATTYCFLSEYLFQNGMVGLQCGGELAGAGARAEYLLGMSEHALPLPPLSPPPLSPLSHSQRDVTDKKPRSRRGEGLYPVLLHANYCGDKQQELVTAGLWLVSSSSSGGQCSRMTAAHSSLYHLHNWTASIAQAQALWTAAVRQPLLNNSLVRFPHEDTAHLVVNGRLRNIPNMATFEKMGYSKHHVQLLSVPFHRDILPVDSALPDLT